MSILSQYRMVFTPTTSESQHRAPTAVSGVSTLLSHYRETFEPEASGRSHSDRDEARNVHKPIVARC